LLICQWNFKSAAACDFQSWRANSAYEGASNRKKQNATLRQLCRIFAWHKSFGRSLSKYKKEQETKKTMKHLYKLAFVLVIGTGFALAQAGAGQGSQSPSTYPSQPGAQQTPDSSQTGQSGSAAASTKAQSDIQSALRKQMPASADSVTVSVSQDNKVRLSGTVSSDTEKQQIEEIAHSAAPNVDIENKLKVSASPSAPGSMPPASSKPPKLRLVAYSQAGSQTSPSTQSPSTQSPSSSTPPSAEPSGSTEPKAQQGGNSGDVQDKIQKALQQDTSLANANITVNVSGDKVELTGTVASRDQKKTAKQIAESNAGGMKVVDHLKVEGGASASPSTPATPPKN
jgi:osmotically-inducible protein OsmY